MQQGLDGLEPVRKGVAVSVYDEQLFVSSRARHKADRCIVHHDHVIATARVRWLVVRAKR
jgi:hypothetical protein